MPKMKVKSLSINTNFANCDKYFFIRNSHDKIRKIYTKQWLKGNCA